MIRIAWLAVVFVAASAVATPVQQPGGSNPDARITVESQPGGTMLVRDVRGDYRQHPTVFKELMAVRDASYMGVGDCFGIYPMDPDAVESPSELRWRVGVRVAAKAGRALVTPKAPYKLETLRATEAAVLRTSVESAPIDGLAFLRWLPENGYVQIMPTRMEYLSHDGNPMLIPSKIVVPVKKRPSGLVLAPRRSADHSVLFPGFE
jgi:hypothetical protein